MDISTEHVDGLTVLRIEGKVDTVSSAAVQQALTHAIEAADAGVVVDMSGVSFVSSAGLRVMLIGAKASKAKGAIFRLAALNATVADVFRMTGFDRLIDIHDTAESAKSIA